MPPRRGLRLLVTVTFNENQLRAHLLPLVSLTEVESVVLVTDEHPSALPKVTTIVPPRWLQRLVGRAAAKFIICLVVARRVRPDWVIGFNLVPHGLNAIAVAAMVRTRSLYEMIGGDREWLGGGWDSDNSILGKLPRPSATVERFLLARIRRSTAVVVMGERGRQALLDRGVRSDRIHIVPPAVDVDRFTSDGRPTPELDIVTVGALLPNKRTTDLLHAAALIHPEHPELRVAVAGGGPLLAELRDLVRTLKLEAAVELCGFRAEVATLYRSARIFTLTSAYEGLSVALIEAMASGVVPVVYDVGELSTVVRDGETGRVVPFGDVERLSEVLSELLDDSEQQKMLAAAAVAEARRYASVAVVARTYGHIVASTNG